MDGKDVKDGILQIVKPMTVKCHGLLLFHLLEIRKKD